MIVCLCTATDDRTIRSAIEDGASSVEEVALRCRAGTCCGGCRDYIAEMIETEGERRRLPVLACAACAWSAEAAIPALITWRPLAKLLAMKGDVQVLEILNQVLTHELTAINQYFIHAKMCENWGYVRLATKIRTESIDEMKHADELISRILFLEGVPNLQRLGKVNVGETVGEQLRLDLDVEKHAIKYLNDSCETCRAKGDHGSFELLKSILVSEEAHADWIEEQLGLIEQVGEQNYLAQQIR